MIPVVLREFKLILGRKRNWFFLFLLPVLFLLLVGLVLDLGREKHENLRIPVVDLDEGEVSSVAIRMLNGVEGIVLELETDDNKSFTKDRAENIIRKGNRRIALMFPKDFSRRIRNNEPVEVVLILDPSLDPVLTGSIKGTISSVLDGVIRDYTRWMKETTKDSNKETGEKIGEESHVGINTETGKSETGDEKNNENPPALKQEKGHVNLRLMAPGKSMIYKIPTTGQQTVTGIAVIWAFFISFYILQVPFREEQTGTMNRIKLSPLGKASYITGLFIPYLIICLVQIALIFVVGLFYIQIDIRSIPAIIIVSIFLSSVSVAYGIYASSWGGTFLRKLGGNLAFIIISAIIGGCTVPLYRMGYNFQVVAHIIPQGWAMESFLYGILNPGHLSGIIIPCAIMLLYSAIFLGLAYTKYKL
ncbi:MAG: ABC transporter permease [Candidatus Eremiobacteraeota bacterium]|nr:ABC transporter permease [Candidatus Eremiobacteraeota bacterium]